MNCLEGLEYGATWADLGYEYARSGDSARAREILDRMKRLPEIAGAFGGDFALVHVALGEYDQALTDLEQALARHADHLLEYSLDPRLRPLHASPRFTQMLRRMNLPLR